MLLKCCTQYVSKFGKPPVNIGLEKVSFSFQSQRKAMPKNVQTTAQLHSSHILAKYVQNPPRSASKYVKHELPDVQAGFRKGRGTRDQITNIHWIIEEAKEFQKNSYFCFIDYVKAFDCVYHNKLENSSRDGSTRPPYLSPVKAVYGSRLNS